MIKHNPLSIAELKAKLYSIRKPHQEHTQGLKPSEKLALLITKKIGTIGFFFIIFAWSFLWIGWNTIVPVSLRFDPYPAKGSLMIVWILVLRGQPPPIYQLDLASSIRLLSNIKLRLAISKLISSNLINPIKVVPIKLMINICNHLCLAKIMMIFGVNYNIF